MSDLTPEAAISQTVDTAVETTTDAAIADVQPVEAGPAAEVAPAPETPAEAPTEADFLASLPDDLRGQVQKFKTGADLAKGYVDLQSFIGKKIDQLTPEEIAGLRGRPDSQDDYTLPESLSKDEEFAGWFKGTSHELGLTKEQAAGLTDSFVKINEAKHAEAMKRVEAEQEQLISDIKREFGSGYESKIALAKRAAEHFGGKELLNYFKETGVDANTNILKAFHRIGQDMLEQSMVSGNDSQNFGPSLPEVQQKIVKNLSNKEFMKTLSNPTAPGHTSAKQTMERLYEQQAKLKG